MGRERIGLSQDTQSSSRLPAASSETLSGDRTLTLSEIDQYNLWAFDPGGAGRNVDLPVEESSDGAVLLIANTADAAEVLTVRDDGTNTIVTPTQNEAALVWCDGSSWFGMVGTFS